MKNFGEICSQLRKLKVDFEVVEFDDTAISARTNDTSIGGNYDPKNAIKTLILKTDESFIAVVIGGGDRVDDKKLSALVGKWRVATADELRKLGLVAGGVCPLVLEMEVLVDKQLMNQKIWSMGAGDTKHGINVKLEVVLGCLKCEMVSIAEKKNMNTEEKVRLITRNCQEVLTEEDLRELIESGRQVEHYIGFEISGLVHLGTGLLSMGKIADFLQTGARCRVFLADFHTFLNNKLGGKWENIRWASENYFKQALIASLKCWGLKGDEVEFVSGKELYGSRPDHWQNFMEIGKQVTLSRNLRSISIMGKKQGTEVDMATLFYPPLQVADIVTMGVNLAHAGMDQRKAHVIAREAIKKIPGNHQTPVAIHQNLIAGLSGPQMAGVNDEESLKMSKSKPNSAVFIHDGPDEIRNKIKKAYGPPKITEFNPLINWVETLVFWGEKTGEFTIDRPERFGGKVVYNTMTDLVSDYKSERLFPLDLKNALADWLVEKLEPARKHFDDDKQKEALIKMKELLAKK